MPKKIIIDTDPGIDDAMAILFALRSPELEVVGLTAVFGNAQVETTAQNALRLVELEGHAHIPVASGAGKPLVRPLRRLGTHVHGEDGFGNSHLAPPSGKLVDSTAAEFMIETVTSHPGEITLIPIGPLTNLALALSLEPRIVGLVKEVILMGGSAYARGNATPAAEANIANDPEAARLVIEASWPVTMVGLDVTHRVVMTPEYLRRLYKAGNRATTLIEQILPVYQDYHAKTHGMGGSIHTHDPSAIAYAIDPDLYQTTLMPVYVETEGLSAGDTIPDPHHQWLQTPEIRVCLGVDDAGVLDLYLQRLSA